MVGRLVAEVVWKELIARAILFLQATKPFKENTSMRMMMSGFMGWVRMEKTSNENLKLTDTAITVVGTMLVAVTWVMLR